MATPTYTALATTTLSGTDTSVTFSSIPASYRDLVLIWNGESTGADYSLRVRFNGDSTTQYSSVAMYNNGSTPSSFSETTTSIFGGVSAGSTTGGTNLILQVMDYSATDKHKTTLARGNQDASIVYATAGRWSNTARITSMEVFASGDAWAAGTTLSLYGIEA